MLIDLHQLPLRPNLDWLNLARGLGLDAIGLENGLESNRFRDGHHLDHQIRTVVYPLLLTSLVLSSFYLVFSVLLLSGVKREKKVLLLPWLIWSAFYFFIGIGCAIFEISAGGGSLTSQIVNPIVYVLVHALWAYCILCIVAYYQSLKASDQKRKDQASNEHEYVDGLRPYYDEEACHRVQHKAIVHLDEVIHPRIHPHSMWSEPDDWEETRRQISWSKRTM
eukprot:maker-scaffold170_size291898-snap-gene-1.58 protein:Tk03032 transcript:maker-scaffold170_size291898-snap-gene-1.58-mRNA-1 annotation:"PREDICTED: uncharacterized protein LOC102800791"